MRRPLRLKPRVRPRDTLRGSKAKPKRSELDRLCREVVFKRDGHACRRCTRHTGKLDWAHVYSRRFLSVRWNPNNSMVLCAGCHFWAHQNPIEAGKFFETVVADKYEGLRLAVREGKTPSAHFVRADLEYLLRVI